MQEFPRKWWVLFRKLYIFPECLQLNDNESIENEESADSFEESQTGTVSAFGDFSDLSDADYDEDDDELDADDEFWGNPARNVHLN